MDECLEGLDGCAVIVDDIIIWGHTKEEHDKNLRNVLQRCRQKGIRLNKDKLEVGISEVRYFGHIISSEGLKPDPEKISAILDMDPPKDKSELETILGMIVYLSKFAPNLSDIVYPLRQVLKKDVLFHWEVPQQKAFEEVKRILTQAPVLTYYDPKKPLVLQCDSSKYGLGATLLQDGKPIAYASKSLTPSEVNWAQIEKELFAVLFGMTRFRQYVYGRQVLVQTDHLPLISIMKKPVHVAPPRLQRMMLQLQGYDFQLEHKAGTQIPLADTLSRKFLPDTCPELSEKANFHVHFVTKSLPYSDRKFQEIRSHTQQDEELQLLKNVILTGWPENRKDCPSQLFDYWNFRDELVVNDDIIMKGQRLLIPARLRPEMLEIIHSGHFGTEKCLRRARSTMFWPRITADITDKVAKCVVCLEQRSSNPKEPLIPHELPDRPWQNVATDVFTLQGQDYLLIVDYYSHYFEYAKLSNTTSSVVIKQMKQWFARHGIPEKLVSDGASYYTSQQFKDFAITWDFTHIFSSPHYPQSNGLAESYVKIVKMILKKSKQSGKDPAMAVLEYRATPLNIGYSPAELLMGRKIRSFLPISPKQLIPKAPEPEQVKQLLSSQKDLQKSHYNKTATPLKPLSIGEPVRIQQDTWKPATVVQKHNDRSYTVQTPEGAEYCRNRRHLLKTNEPPHPQILPDFSIPETPDINDPPKLTNENPCEPQPPQPKNPRAKPESSFSARAEDKSKPYISRYGRTVTPKIIESM
jgi:hypothetical protein